MCAKYFWINFHDSISFSEKNHFGLLLKIIKLRKYDDKNDTNLSI